MPKVTFLPMNTTVEAREGDSILDTAIAHDVALPHACGGVCACTTCRIEIRSGAGNVISEMEEDEQERLEAVGCLTPGSRLGCQARVHGDVTVEIMNPDEF